MRIGTHMVAFKKQGRMDGAFAPDLATKPGIGG